MKNPKIRTQVVHSKTQSAWNVVATYPVGCKYKIARVPYFSLDDDKITSMNREEAFEHAQYISYCFNNSDQICNPNHINTSKMSNFKTRLLEEKAQLDERLENLKAFRNSENFQNISHVQQTLLNLQLDVMTTYNHILKERISWLTPADELPH